MGIRWCLRHRGIGLGLLLLALCERAQASGVAARSLINFCGCRSDSVLDGVDRMAADLRSFRRTLEQSEERRLRC